MSQYTHSSLPTETIIYTDSASLIAKNQRSQEMAVFFPNSTIDPDWDILQQIITSRRLFPSLPVLRFVKGHQDADCPYATMPLPAQLNIDADHLAGSYAPRPTENHSIVLMIGTVEKLQFYLLDLLLSGDPQCFSVVLDSFS